MPSSMIFASLVVVWLLILVPAVARRRQEVARPSVAALSGRVLDRPRQRQVPAPGREREVDGMDETGRVEIEDDDQDHDRIDGHDRIDDHDHDRVDDYDDPPARGVAAHDDRRWEPPQPRYRPGRGGFDPEAAALAARTRYAFRQRVVLTMLITALVTGVIAAAVVQGMWWVHGAVDLALVGYLVYLRRQVRLEEAIRERRAARMAGTRRPAAADDPELDAWARRGRELTRRDDHHAADDDWADDYADDQHDDWDDEDDTADDGRDHEAARAEHDEPEPADPEPALPRLRPAPPPALPAGTSLLEADEDDPDLYDLGGPARPGYRRAAGE
ncbi:gephyrin-like molybdotransferase receptor GlpR [Pseudonocardia zijingensis]|uniref:DUF3040 family protein n=1 Tax=Pseudonocardia zijingensis TaxID=153376 RepID=A0ABN1PA05_9PSEU